LKFLSNLTFMLPRDHEKMTISCLGLKIGWTIGCLGPQARESFSISSKPKQRFHVLESKNMNLLNSISSLPSSPTICLHKEVQHNGMKWGWKSSTNGKSKATEEQEFFFCVGGNTLEVLPLSSKFLQMASLHHSSPQERGWIH
jgi:hypothetical protein